MRLFSFRHPTSGSSVGLKTSATHLLDLQPLFADTDSGRSAIRRLLEAFDGIPKLSASDLDGLQDVAIEDVNIEPIVPDPTKVIAAPVNYRDHQQEMNEDYGIDALGVFLKAPSSVLGHGGTVVLPYTDRRFDQEGELAVVISRTARFLDVADALTYVAG